MLSDRIKQVGLTGTPLRSVTGPTPKNSVCRRRRIARLLEVRSGGAERDWFSLCSCRRTRRCNTNHTLTHSHTRTHTHAHSAETLHAGLGSLHFVQEVVKLRQRQLCRKQEAEEQLVTCHLDTCFSDADSASLAVKNYVPPPLYHPISN